MAKNKWGRPLMFETVEILQKQIEKYFESCYELQWNDRIKRDEDWNKLLDSKNKYKYEPYQEKVMIQVPTVSWLAVALDTSRRTLINYEEREEFFPTIKRAKQFIESAIEEWMLKNKLNPTWVIFNLKNNFGWVDKQEVENINKNYTMWEILEELDEDTDLTK